MRGQRMSRKQRQNLYSWLRTVAGLLIGLIMAIPFFWMVVCAFQKDSSSLFTMPPTVPNFSNFANFAYYLNETPFWSQLGVTFLLVFSNMVIGTLASIFVAYGFARFKAPGKKMMFTLLLSTMMLPWVVTMVPAYMLFAKMNMIGTYWPLILPSIGGNAFYVFLLRQFFMSIPHELDDAARIDGCNSFQILWRIILPNCWPILATIAIFSFNSVWSDYIGPSIYILDTDQYTLSLGLQYLKTANYGAPQWQYIMAGCVIYSLPMVVVYLTFQKAFVRGAMGSAIK